MTFTLEGMSYIMTFTPSSEPGPFQVAFDRRDQTHLHVDTRGHFPAGAIGWTYSGILQFTDADIDLDLMIHSETAKADSVRRMAFTFSARQKATTAMIDPTSSAPAYAPPLTPGSAPPGISVRTL